MRYLIDGEIAIFDEVKQRKYTIYIIFTGRIAF